MNIAIDIDSTLHHYWDQLSDAAQRRFGIALPYEEQVTWGITLLRPEQVRACVQETHSEQRVLAAQPYPGAVEAVRAWHADGHFIHITSHRATDCQDATERWLRRIALPFDELYCSYDKIARCREIGIDIDSTLHHYWDQLEAVARRRFGVALDYHAQVAWGITDLDPEQLGACIADPHDDVLLAGAEPYPGAGAVVRR